jgi:hypothetical protein
MHTPINPIEHAENVAELIRIANKIKSNQLTFGDFRELVLLHRLTFYAKHHEGGQAAFYERMLIEDIFDKQITPNSVWNDEEHCYKSDHSLPIKLHWQHRKKLVEFATGYAEKVVKVVKRSHYAYIIYQGITDHRTYLKLKGSKIWSFIDQKDDEYWVSQFRHLAKLHNVKDN